MGKLFSKKVLATMLSAGLLATSSGALSAFASSEVKQSVSQAVEAYDKKLNKKDSSKAKKDGEPILSKIIKTGVGVATVLAGLYFLPKGVRYLFTKNYVMPVDGQCKDGFKLENDRCYCIGDALLVGEECKGFEGATQQKDGSWACAKGYKPVNGKCAIYCDKNAHLVANQEGDKCICEKGYLQNEDKCVKESNCKEGFHLNIFTGECISNDSCAKTGFVSLPDETCGCPKGTTLTDGECKDFVKPSSQYLMLAECPENFWFDRVDYRCYCNGAATLENGKCIPHKNAEYSTLSKEWVCPKNRVSENEACVCDSSKRFVPSSDGDACVCENNGLVETEEAGCVEENKCNMLYHHLNLITGKCDIDVEGAKVDLKTQQLKCLDQYAEIRGSKCECIPGYTETNCGCIATPEGGYVDAKTCEPVSDIIGAKYDATKNAFTCGKNEQEKKGSLGYSICVCKDEFVKTEKGCVKDTCEGNLTMNYNGECVYDIEAFKFNDATGKLQCVDKNASLVDGIITGAMCMCNDGFTKTAHGCIKTPKNGKVDEKTCEPVSIVKGIVKYDAENNAFVCGENAEEHGWIFKSCDCKKEYVNVNGECVRATCEPGLTLKEDGKCHCNIDGATYDENKKLCVCPENMKVNQAGDKCICADGYSMTKNGCMKNNCQIGAALDNFGRCTTIKNIEFERDQDDKIIGAKCPEGTKLSDNGLECESVCCGYSDYNKETKKCEHDFEPYLVPAIESALNAYFYKCPSDFLRPDCPKGSKLNHKWGGVCVPNFEGSIFDQEKNEYVCQPHSKPSTNGNKCICEKGYVELENGTCVKDNCPKNGKVNLKTGECESAIMGGNLNEAQTEYVCPKGTKLSEDGNKCVSVCAKGYVYNPDNEKCYKEAERSFWGLGNYKCSEGETLNKIKATGDVVCLPKKNG